LAFFGKKNFFIKLLKFWRFLEKIFFIKLLKFWRFWRKIFFIKLLKFWRFLEKIFFYKIIKILAFLEKIFFYKIIIKTNSFSFLIKKFLIHIKNFCILNFQILLGHILLFRIVNLLLFLLERDFFHLLPKFSNLFLF